MLTTVAVRLETSSEVNCVTWAEFSAFTCTDVRTELRLLVRDLMAVVVKAAIFLIDIFVMSFTERAFTSSEVSAPTCAVVIAFTWLEFNAATCCVERLPTVAAVNDDIVDVAKAAT